MKKKIILVISLILVFTKGYTQIFTLSSNQQFIEDAVKDGIFIIKQQYQLQDVETQQLYGRNNKEYFNEIYSLVLKLNGSYCGGGDAVFPWETDSFYEEYKNNSKYIPVISKTQYRRINEKEFKEFPFDTLSRVPLVSEKLYTFSDGCGDFGFQIDFTDGLKKGWLVWVTSKSDIRTNESVETQLDIYRHEVTFQKNKIEYTIENPNITDPIIGGLYILPQVSRIGQLTFYLCGYVEKVDGKWSLVTFGDSTNSSLEKDGFDLTPIEEEIDSVKITN